MTHRDEQRALLLNVLYQRVATLAGEPWLALSHTPTIASHDGDGYTWTWTQIGDRIHVRVDDPLGPPPLRWRPFMAGR